MNRHFLPLLALVTAQPVGPARAGKTDSAPAMRVVGEVKAQLAPYRDMRPIGAGRFVLTWNRATSCLEKGWSLIDLEEVKTFEVCVPARAVPNKAELIYFSAQHDEIGLLIKESKKTKGRFRTRSYYSSWQLSRAQEAYRVLLDDASGTDTPEADYIITSYGPGPQDRYHVFFAYQLRGKEPGTFIELIQFDRSTKQIASRYRIESSWAQSGVPFVQASPNFTLFAIAEYSERGYGRAPMYVVRPGWNKHIEFEAPFAPYGMAFDIDDRHLVVGSNYGDLHLFDVRKGKKLRVVKTTKRLHSVVLSTDSRRLYVFPRGKRAHVHDWPTLERITKLAATDFSSVGEAFAGDRLIAGAKNRLLIPSGDKHGFPKDEDPLVVLEIIEFIDGARKPSP